MTTDEWPRFKTADDAKTSIRTLLNYPDEYDVDAIFHSCYGPDMTSKTYVQLVHGQDFWDVVSLSALDNELNA